jgi:hypothetical protein
LLGGNRRLLRCLLLRCLLLGCLLLRYLSGLRLLLDLILNCCLLLCRLRAEGGFRCLAGFRCRIAQCAPGWQRSLGIDTRYTLPSCSIRCANART